MGGTNVWPFLSLKALSLSLKEVILHGDLWAANGGSSPAPGGQNRVCGVAGARGDICDVAGGSGETSVLELEREEGGEC